MVLNRKDKEQKFIEKLIRDSGCNQEESISQVIAEEFDKIRKTEKQVHNVWFGMKEERKKYEAKTKELKKKLHNIREQCSHPMTTYYPDASGNNDCWTCCDICGKEFPGRNVE